MKKLILIIIVAITFVSCSKESVKPCNCGLIVSDNVANYSVTIRNECSQNLKTFYLTEGDWLNAYVGSNYCITNSGSW
jgi:hypothetical protein